MATEQERIATLEEQMEIVTGLLVVTTKALKKLGIDFSEFDLTDDD